MKKIGVVLTALALAGVVAGCLLTINKYKKDPSLPALEGVIEVPGLSGEAKVYRDQYGIPHIFSENEEALFFAIGYVQAQDRLWEMVLLRAVAEGRLSELFGYIGVPGQELQGFALSTFDMDKRQRIMGMKWLGEVGEELLKEVNPGVYSQLDNYCRGVNYFISTHRDWAELPLEFQLLKVRPEPFRVADIVSFGRFIGSMLCGNMGQELLRYALIKKYGPDLGWQLAPLHHALGPTIVPKEMLKNRLAEPRDLPPGGRPSDQELGFTPDFDPEAALDLMLAENAVRKALYVKAPLASNDWVVSGKLTETGTAMLANDPHLEHVEPSLFYLMHVKGAGFDSFGVTFPGNPYTVLAHTKKLAWGATTSSADVQDLFIETTDPGRPGQYLHRGEWRDFVEREEVIKVRVGPFMIDRKLKIQQSIHGPIINQMAGLPKDTPPIAMRWVAWDFDRNVKMFEALITSATIEEFMAKYRALPEEEFTVRNVAIMYNLLMKGESIDDFVRAMDMIVLPNQSWVAADADGHIAYLPGGLVPVRGKGIGVMPVPGESGEFDWTGFIPLMELPHAIDPERGYMATANNEVVDAEWYPYVFSTSYGDGWRAWRIEELIQKYAPISLEDMAAIQNDVYVKKAEWQVPIILRAVERKRPTDALALRAAEELENWDFVADLDSTATVIFYQFNKELPRNVLEDEMPEKDYRAFLSGGQSKNLERWLEAGSSPFFDDKRTPGIEDMDDMIVKSLIDAMAWVEKKYGPDPRDREWGKVHWIKFYHPLGWGFLKDLSVGPFPHLGGDQTVRNASTAGFGRAPYKCLGGPVLRHLIDMGDPENALIMIDGSQSGQWLSPHYRDLHEFWVQGRYVKAVMDPVTVEQQSRHLLRFQPAEKDGM